MNANKELQNELFCLRCNTIPEKLLSEFSDAINRSKIIVEDNYRFYYFKDLLEDASCAISTYCVTTYPISKHEGYLYTYGLFQALYLQIIATNYFQDAFGIDDKYINKLRKTNETIVRFYKNAFANIDHPKHGKYFTFNQIDMNKDKISGLICRKNPEPQPYSVDVYENICRASSYSIAVLRRIIEMNPEQEQIKETSLTLSSVTDRFYDFDDLEAKLLTQHPLWKPIYEELKQWVDDCKELFASMENTLENMDSYILFSKIFSSISDIFEALENRFPPCIEESCQKYRDHHIELLFYKLKDLNSFCKKYYLLENSHTIKE